jgi:hypothetical protein
MAKFLVALLTTVIIAAQAPISDGKITTAEWIMIVTSALGTGAVWGVPNQPHGEHESP